MRVYVAGSRHELNEVREVQEAVIDRGHAISFDWTGEDGEIRADWRGHEQRARHISDTELQAVRDSDLLILVAPQPGHGLGLYVETGAALGLRKEVWLYGKVKESVFWYQGQVTRYHRLDCMEAELDFRALPRQRSSCLGTDTLAAEIATRLYEYKTDDVGLPAIRHPEAVADHVSPRARPAAWLHDVVEDGLASSSELERAGVDLVALAAVATLTRNPSETYADYIDCIAWSAGPAGEIAREVKLADLHHNLARPGNKPGLRDRYLEAIRRLENA